MKSVVFSSLIVLTAVFAEAAVPNCFNHPTKPGQFVTFGGNVPVETIVNQLKSEGFQITSFRNRTKQVFANATKVGQRALSVLEAMVEKNTIEGADCHPRRAILPRPGRPNPRSAGKGVPCGGSAGGVVYLKRGEVCPFPQIVPGLYDPNWMDRSRRF